MNRLVFVLALAAATAACSGAQNGSLPPTPDGPEALGPDAAPTTADAHPGAVDAPAGAADAAPSSMDGGAAADAGPLASLVINEVAAKGDPNDWFEVENTGSSWVDLTGFGYSDDLSVPLKAKFPAGVMLAPGEFYAQSLASAGFGFGSAEEAGIFEPDGRLIDSVKWNKGDSPSGGSYGRIPDATGPFMTLTTPTPGAANVAP